MNSFEKVCRLCLNETGPCNIFALPDLPHDIYLCTGITVSSTDTLPQRICPECLDIVRKAKQLRLLASVNESNLKMVVLDGAENTKETDIPVTIPVTPNDTQRPYVSIRSRIKFEDDSDEELLIDLNHEKKLDVPLKDATKTPKVPQPVKCKNEPVHVEKKPKLKCINCDKKDSATPYKCNICVKYFKTWKQCYLHERVHCKYIHCEICSKWFATKGDLEKHLRVHTGVKPFKCDICARSFTQKVTLRLHIENVHLAKKSKVKESSPIGV